MDRLDILPNEVYQANFKDGLQILVSRSACNESENYGDEDLISDSDSIIDKSNKSEIMY